MTEYNAADTKQIRKAVKAAKAADAERELVVLNLMSTPAGRGYMHARLVRCHVFESSFNSSALAMAFAEGERNIGLQDLIDVMRFAPDQYVQMMREANDRASGSSGNRANGNGTDRGPDSGPDLGVPSDWDPYDAERAEDAS